LTTQESIRARVVFRKQVSDGNYGTESAEVALDVPLGEVYDLSEEAVAATLETARRLVHEELSKSPAWRVRDAVKPELPAEPATAADPEEIPF
jgi:hypothetical protein